MTNVRRGECDVTPSKPPCSVQGCDKPASSRSRGMCKMHETRVRRTGSIFLKTMSLQDRIKNSSVEDAITGCWIWMRHKMKKGYGRLRVKGKKMVASRASWVAHNGDIPDGMHVCHRCDNPSCVNPSHLFLGTARDNVQDCISKGRFRGWDNIPNPMK